jgi:hypothetical protein
MPYKLSAPDLHSPVPSVALGLRRGHLVAVGLVHLGLGAPLSGVEVRTPLDVVNAQVREAYEAKALVGSRKIVVTLVATARTSAE